MHARQTRSPVFHRDFITKVLAAEIATPAAELVDTPIVHLLKSVAFAPTWETPQATFTLNKSDFTDYAGKALVLTGPRNIGVDGLANGGVVNWLMTTDPAVTGNRVYGYYVEDADGMVCFEEFDAQDQIDMQTFGDSLVLEVLLPFIASQPVEG